MTKNEKKKKSNKVVSKAEKKVKPQNLEDGIKVEKRYKACKM